jgi:UDP-N-acetylmuramate--alanine ligase
MIAAGEDPSYLVGGEVRSTGSNAGWGSGKWLIVEADESDRSLLKLQPEVAVLTNAELDHHTTYSSQRDVDDTFRQFLAKAQIAVVWDRPGLLALADGTPVVPFDAKPELTAGGSRFDLDGLAVELTVPGEHNARNAAAALMAAAIADEGVAAAIAGGGELPWSSGMRRAASSLVDFQGAGRRFERLGRVNGAEVVDDYAHHPTEVAATLAAARTLEPRRLVAVFQPHLYSRTQRLAREFGAALARADVAAVLDVYPARERAEDFPGVSGLLVAEATADAAGGRTVLWLPSFEVAEPVLRGLLREGDLVLTLGAGDVSQLGPEVLRRLGRATC